jgi:hypothetical protein
MSIDPVFELMEIRPQSECAFASLAKPGLGIDEAHAELPESHGSEAVGNCELGCRNGDGVHTGGFEHGGEVWFFRNYKGDEFGAESAISTA